MADTVVPRTPTPTPVARGSKALGSPPPISSSELTPPPSTQPQRTDHTAFAGPLLGTLEPSARLASPPDTTKPAAAYHSGRPELYQKWNGPLPNSAEINGLSDRQMRELLHEALPALGEARLALAHSQLQLNLLSIEKAEAAQRAEAEHDLTRREVEVLQAGTPVLPSRTTLYPDPHSPLTQARAHLEASIRQCSAIEAENDTLQRRLKQAKRIIKHLDSKNAVLVDNNRLLRERIRQNREHFNEIRQFGLAPQSSSSSQQQLQPHSQLFQRSQYLPSTPQSQRKQQQQQHHSTPSALVAPPMPRSRSHNPLDALLMADQILSGEPSSLPTTPAPHRFAARQHHHHAVHHARGTHSLSSLPTTPLRTSRPMTADEALRTPVNQIIPAPYAASNFSAPPAHEVRGPSISHERRREDRDSTISASEEDQAITDEDLPASQASQAASGMLRRYAGPASQTGPKGRQERMVQNQLVGKVTKSGATRKSVEVSKDQDGDEETRRRKRARTAENVGLGIGMWPSPRA